MYPNTSLGRSKSLHCFAERARHPQLLSPPQRKMVVMITLCLAAAGVLVGGDVAFGAIGSTAHRAAQERALSRSGLGKASSVFSPEAVGATNP